MDAVVAMEGQGPGSGDPTNTGLVIAGTSTYAVDRIAAEIIGFSEKEVPTLYLAKKRNLPGSDIKDIVIKGLPLSAARVRKFKFAKSSYNPAPTFLKSAGRRLFTARPCVVEEKCIACGNCEKICAAKAIEMGKRKGSKIKKPVFDYEKCIRCYCCHEICPAKAIELKKGLFAGLFA
jgi:NAD-dependent dihydropyrimidine dehydrogenase PreA subunit